MSQLRPLLLLSMLNFMKVLSIGCLSDTNSPVDWWIILKHPESYNYSYSDVNNSSLLVSKHTLDKEEGALGMTLQQIYTDTSNENISVGYALWNNQEPNGKNHGSPKAHAKGALGFNSVGGFWLTHSLPKFPNYIKDSFKPSWDLTSNTYGQSFLCISLTPSGIEDVAQSLQVDRLPLYDSKLPQTITHLYPQVSNLLNEENTEQNFLIKHIQSKAGNNFLRISKSAAWASTKSSAVHFYENLVAPTLHSDIAVESWENGVGSMQSSCKDEGFKLNVMNIRHITMPGGVETGSWSSTQDHSKWAITLPQTKLKFFRVCIGDLNRQEGQTKRGGGTVCMLKFPEVYREFAKSINNIESCKSKFLE
eukprot:GSMAST32.ASY1.ANO1.2428.1 assembled CDS